MFLYQKLVFQIFWVTKWSLFIYLYCRRTGICVFPFCDGVLKSTWLFLHFLYKDSRTQNQILVFVPKIGCSGLQGIKYISIYNPFTMGGQPCICNVRFWWLIEYINFTENYLYLIAFFLDFSTMGVGVVRRLYFQNGSWHSINFGLKILLGHAAYF